MESEKAKDRIRDAHLVVCRCCDNSIGLVDARDGERLGGRFGGGGETARGEALTRGGRIWSVSGPGLVHGSDGRSHPPEKNIVDEKMGERDGCWWSDRSGAVQVWRGRRGLVVAETQLG